MTLAERVEQAQLQAELRRIQDREDAREDAKAKKEEAKRRDQRRQQERDEEKEEEQRLRKQLIRPQSFPYVPQQHETVHLPPAQTTATASFRQPITPCPPPIPIHIPPTMKPRISPPPLPSTGQQFRLSEAHPSSPISSEHDDDQVLKAFFEWKIAAQGGREDRQAKWERV